MHIYFFLHCVKIYLLQLATYIVLIYNKIHTVRRNVMQISKFTDYAFRSLIYLARNQDEIATVDKLAK